MRDRKGSEGVSDLDGDLDGGLHLIATRKARNWYFLLQVIAEPFT